MSEVDEWGEVVNETPKPDGVFDENALGAVEGPVRNYQVATAGLGTGIDDLLSDLATTGSSQGTFDLGQSKMSSPSATASTSRADRAIGITSAVTAGMMDIAGGIMGMVQGYRQSEADRAAASQELTMQMRVFDERIAAARDERQRANLEAQRAQAQSALNSGDISQILAALQASQSQGVPTWVWVLGGVAVLGIGGIVLWKVLD